MDLARQVQQRDAKGISEPDCHPQAGLALAALVPGDLASADFSGSGQLGLRHPDFGPPGLYDTSDVHLVSLAVASPSQHRPHETFLVTDLANAVSAISHAVFVTCDEENVGADESSRLRGFSMTDVAHSELLLSRLLRASQGDRACEAAIVLLAEARVLHQLAGCIVVDPDRNLAWVDWPAIHSHAGHAPDGTRAVLLLASAINAQAPRLPAHGRRALRLAIDHLGERSA